MADFDVHYDPITLITEPVEIEIQGLDDVKSRVELDSKSTVSTSNEMEISTDNRLATDSKLDVVVSEPLRVQNSAEVDLKPVVLDQCLSVRYAALPSTCIRQPYQQRLGFSFLGIELFGVSLSGEWQTRVNDKKTERRIPAGKVPSHCDHGEPYCDGLRIRLLD